MHHIAKPDCNTCITHDAVPSTLVLSWYVAHTRSSTMRSKERRLSTRHPIAVVTFALIDRSHTMSRTDSTDCFHFIPVVALDCDAAALELAMFAIAGPTVRIELAPSPLREGSDSASESIEASISSIRSHISNG